MRLQDKVAIITGAGRGIGRATAEKFVAEGAAVVIAELDPEPGEETAQRLTAQGGRARFIRCDITDEESVRRTVEQTLAHFGRLDILVNNAGVNTYFDATEMTQEEWDQAMAVDLKGAWLCAKYALRPMKAARRGSIVNIASIHAIMTTEGMFPYAAAKAGLVGMTRSLALDYGPYGIRVNAVCPGWTHTRLVDEWLARQPDPEAALRRVAELHPLRRIASPAEVANLIAFVASDEASFITGAMLLVDGGLSARFAS
jgi:NAD(P)-dependent dehydrogenase (short-subunit alcohol dehydrogenase family)